MDSYARAGLVFGLFLFTFLINLPFGYMRGKTRKGSFRWFLYIHLPIPLVFLGRTLSHLDMRYVPVFIVAAVAGQLWGGRLES